MYTHFKHLVSYFMNVNISSDTYTFICNFCTKCNSCIIFANLFNYLFLTVIVWVCCCCFFVFPEIHPCFESSYGDWAAPRYSVDQRLYGHPGKWGWFVVYSFTPLSKHCSMERNLQHHKMKNLKPYFSRVFELLLPSYLELNISWLI